MSFKNQQLGGYSHVPKGATWLTTAHSARQSVELGRSPQDYFTMTNTIDNSAASSQECEFMIGSMRNQMGTKRSFQNGSMDALYQSQHLSLSRKLAASASLMNAQQQVCQSARGMNPQLSVRSSQQNVPLTSRNPLCAQGPHPLTTSVSIDPNMRKSKTQLKEEKSLSMVRNSIDNLLSMRSPSGLPPTSRAHQPSSRLEQDFAILEQKYFEQQQVNEDLKAMVVSASNGNLMGSGNCMEDIQLVNQVKRLEEKLDEAHRQSHDLENTLEEYEVKIKQAEDISKNANKKFQDIQKKFVTSEQQRKELIEKNRKLETDKTKISEKWIRLSAQNKKDDRQRSKLREAESSCNRETEVLSERLEQAENEINRLRNCLERNQKADYDKDQTIQNLENYIQELQEEKGLADQVTQELLQRIETLQDSQSQGQSPSGRSPHQSHMKLLQQDLDQKQSDLNQKQEEVKKLKLTIKAMTEQTQTLRNEMDGLNQYVTMREQVHSKKFSSSTVLNAFKSISDIVSKSKIQVDYLPPECDDESSKLIVDSEVQYVLVLVDKLLKSQGKFQVSRAHSPSSHSIDGISQLLKNTSSSRTQLIQPKTTKGANNKENRGPQKPVSKGISHRRKTGKDDSLIPPKGTSRPFNQNRVPSMQSQQDFTQLIGFRNQMNTSAVNQSGHLSVRGHDRSGSSFFGNSRKGSINTVDTTTHHHNEY